MAERVPPPAVGIGVSVGTVGMGEAVCPFTSKVGSGFHTGQVFEHGEEAGVIEFAPVFSHCRVEKLVHDANICFSPLPPFLQRFYRTFSAERLGRNQN